MMSLLPNTDGSFFTLFTFILLQNKILNRSWDESARALRLKTQIRSTFSSFAILFVPSGREKSN